MVMTIVHQWNYKLNCTASALHPMAELLDLLDAGTMAKATHAIANNIWLHFRIPEESEIYITSLVCGFGDTLAMYCKLQNV